MRLLAAIFEVDTDDGALEGLEKLANTEALNHYIAIIGNLREKGFKVFVCLNHFTLPYGSHQ